MQPIPCILLHHDGWLDGIKKKLDPGDPVDEDVYKLSKAKRKELGIKELPTTLKDALDEMESDDSHQRNLRQPRFRRIHRTENQRLEPVLPVRFALGNNEVPRLLSREIEPFLIFSIFLDIFNLQAHARQFK